MSDPIDQFRNAISNAGLTPPEEIISDGAIHRFSTSGKSSFIQTASLPEHLVTGAKALLKTGAASPTNP